VFDRLRTEGAVPLLARFYGFHGPIEEALGGRTDMPELELHRRGKTVALERDLERAGVGARARARLPRLRAPALRTLGEVLGVMYVVEGSTLGGRAIHKECRRLGLDPAGLSFFDVYGAETGPLWRRFCAVLQAHGGVAETSRQASRAAVETFRAAESWLTADLAVDRQEAVA
jgi:heme oxygenase